ncbi:MAG: PhzF family phenazine biosynthesis isomerase [Gammaproteobacteria bacterium]|nr:PhzF family phenazine biosynthesis isomerase [Gammaproteobacteria bacterium]
MTRSVHVFQVDAFTDRRFTGNPAGVVLGADVLADDEMLAIARELNNADTAFVLKADGPDHDVRVRFFTPRTEASFVGHATVAAHYVLSRRDGTPTRLRQRQRQKSGVVEIEVRGQGPQRRIAIRQPAPALGREIGERERLAVLDALALSSGDLDPRCPIQIVGSGSTRLMIGVRGTEQLRHLKPDFNRLNTLSAQLGAAGHFVFTLHAQVEGCLTESRMFCPALGIPEDPVSGNAHGLLGAYLARYGLLPPAAAGRVHFCGAQGQSLHRPGRVDVELELADGGAPAAVWIVGQAVLVFETTLEL